MSRQNKNTLSYVILGMVIVLTLILMAILIRGDRQVVINNNMTPIETTTEPIAEVNGTKLFGGWVDDAEGREAIKSRLATVYFGDTPSYRAMQGDDDKDVLLTDYAKEALGRWIPNRNQLDVGSCVSFAVVDAVEHLLCVQMVEALRAGQPPPTSFKDLAQEVVYGGSRVEIGGGRVRGDGSIVAWAAEWSKSRGQVPRGVYGNYDLTNYSTKICREFGNRGIPDDLENVARLSPVKGITFVRNADEAWKAIGQRYPIAIGSIVGFTGSDGNLGRDANGFLRESGRWGHAMSIVGRATVNGQKAFLFKNSWGDAVHRGGKGGKNIPDSGCFFVRYATVDKMCREGDAIAFSDAVGFPARPLIWVRHKIEDINVDNIPVLHP